MARDPADERWLELVEEHRQALHDFAATAAALPEPAWHAPRALGKWSPAQIAEHLRLTCDTIQAELEGRGGFRIRTSWLRQRLLRLLYLRRMLRTRRFPAGAPAVREIRPDPAARYDQRQTLDALGRQAASLVDALARVDSGASRSVSHPFFGRLAPARGLELSTLHVRHHHAQVLEVVQPPQDSATHGAPVAKPDP